MRWQKLLTVNGPIWFAGFMRAALAVGGLAAMLYGVMGLAGPGDAHSTIRMFALLLLGTWCTLAGVIGVRR